MRFALTAAILAMAHSGGAFDPSTWGIDLLEARPRSITYKQAKRRKRRLGFRK